MWIKNINIDNVQHKGFDTQKYEGCSSLVKRVTVTFDVVMLPVHEEKSDPMERVKSNMDSEIWYLRDPVINAVYKSVNNR